MVLFALVASIIFCTIIAYLIINDVYVKTTHMPSQLIYDVHESIEFCAQALPEAITSQISYDELRVALRLHLEWLQAFHWAPTDRSSLELSDPIVFDETDCIDYILERCDVTTLELDRDQVELIIKSHLSYFEGVGAIDIDDPTLMSADIELVPRLGKGE